MKVQFNNILPLPLATLQHKETSIWKRNFTWESPSKTLLLAVSGRGKSTFVDILSGVRNDFEGDLLIDSKSISSFTTDDWSHYRTFKIATVYQNLQLFDNLTILENIQLKNDLTNHFTLDKIKNLINRIGLTDQINKKSKQLSFGQKQRVAIIRSLAQPFELLILDEPFSHLDLANEKLMTDLIIEELGTNHAGFIMTSLGGIPNCTIDNELTL